MYKKKKKECDFFWYMPMFVERNIFLFVCHTQKFAYDHPQRRLLFTFSPSHPVVGGRAKRDFLCAEIYFRFEIIKKIYPKKASETDSDIYGYSAAYIRRRAIKLAPWSTPKR